ncbi:branched-chain amino acid ABC transporter permease [Granulicatella sp. zg-ZJ]|uniref:branched-chain amino acid ABC transporter permease n=1 Tax=unclassified Granulicatella TaxID=2630493 RepID=UPI0013CFBFDF|nr:MULTISPECIES: branched-chain amino acid ABC transporter permease [unclassified Granulicatella]MBS4749913.1 branched-chain amino acid ABC transporter permease [Carnobacteriaceae bacterium zg-ZUI78]NEW62089.1 branched-chain amino acid ABC transporter permease [Granulicatella sp. zg-ZJ]QMI86130.1 branched-chain amino acid ABC transporter permease [Carnobacteriaceae bacterium zg-84]
MEQLVNAISLGSIYALVALGYTMVYGIIRLINFAHGDILMLGAYIGFALISILKLDFFSALILSMLACAIIGAVIERIAYKPLRKSAKIAALITAIGVSYFIENIMIVQVGAETKVFPDVLGKQSFQLFGVDITLKQVLIFLITISLMVVLTLVIQRTKMGKAMRAVSTDEEAAQLMGINVDNVITFTFLLGSALAGAAGVLVGVYYGAMTPLMGVTPGLKAFIAAVLGGIGSVPGAMLGGYLIGLLETIVNALGFSLYKDAFVYAILVVILIVRPAGLLGKNVKEKV